MSASTCPTCGHTVITCKNCSQPIRANNNSSTGWEHFPASGNPASGWQGIRCPGKLTGAEPEDGELA